MGKYTVSDDPGADMRDTSELMGRVVTAGGSLAAVVTVSEGEAGLDDEETAARARRALAAEFADDPTLTLVDRHGDEVIVDE
jgi:hypothetical protein